MKRTGTDGAVGRQTKKQIGISSAPADHKRRFFFCEWAFELQPGSNKTKSTRGSKLFFIALGHFYIDYRSQPAAVLCRHSSFINGNILYCIRIECGKKTKKV